MAAEDVSAATDVAVWIWVGVLVAAVPVSSRPPASTLTVPEG
ncbi:hypothetical protein AB6O49_03575 [Streptomyces sp. SBR177]